MPSTTIRSIAFSAACFCATAVAQPSAAETPVCGPSERMAFASIAGRGITELRGFLFAKKQLDQLAQYLESKEGSTKWAEATPASQVRLVEAAARSATISSAAITHLPFLPSTRYAFEGQFPIECSKSAQLMAQMREPGFTRYLEVRARVVAVAAAWYASGLFAKLTHDAALPISQPFVTAPGVVPAKAEPAKTGPAKAGPAKAGSSRVGSAKAGFSKAQPSIRKSSTLKPAPVERKIVVADRTAAVDLLLREIGVFNVGMTAIERELLRAGALAAAQTALLNEAVEALADSNLKSLLLDPAYLAFNYAVMITAHRAEPLLIQDYPHLEPLGRNVSQTWAADLLRAAPKVLSPDSKPQPIAPIVPTAPTAPIPPVAPKS